MSTSETPSNPVAHSLAESWQAYVHDTVQRQILYWDVMRRRGNEFLEGARRGNPPVLHFDYETVMDGRTLDRPCNYDLLRILPGEDRANDPDRRPFVIVDPRAGHGPGIGGFKPDSQVGAALENDHPVYFVSFRPEPVPGQTLADVAAAEATFIAEVTRRHPQAQGKPCVVGNCQAGWAVAALASVEPEIMGPILLNGTPLSYWAGVDGKNPMRYAGGLLGGKWLASLASDLGHGRFDGAHLVANFENLNPANTLWGKQYQLYDKVDSEEARYLEFEKWWSGFFLMNAEEMDAIVSELFIGNRLSTGAIETSDGRKVDLRNIRSPIVVFASFGDNITPPQQALNWITDLYGHEDDIVANDQTIVYVLHENIGHLGIFVSGRVARKEHAEIVDTLDVIDTLPPGLYEMLIEARVAGMKHEDLIPGDFVVRIETRTVEDLRRLDDSQHDDEYFTSVPRISELNDQLYQTWVAPWMRLASSEWTAQWLRDLHPLRAQRSLFSDLNPLMAPFAALAPRIKEDRAPIAEGNFFKGLERDASRTVVESLNAFRDLRDNFSRNLFKLIYGPTGWGSVYPPENRRPKDDPARNEAIEARRRGLMERTEQGGFPEGVMRMVIAGMADEGAVDRRSARLARQIWEEHPRLKHIAGPERRRLFKQQATMMFLDEVRALEALPILLPTKSDREAAVAIALEVLMAEPGGEDLSGPLARKVGHILELKVQSPTRPAERRKRSTVAGG